MLYGTGRVDASGRIAERVLVRALSWSTDVRLGIDIVSGAVVVGRDSGGDVERNFGYAVARAFAGHTDSGGAPGPTTSYIRADLSEVAVANAALTGEPHPLAASPDTGKGSRR